MIFYDDFACYFDASSLASQSLWMIQCDSAKKKKKILDFSLGWELGKKRLIYSFKEVSSDYDLFLHYILNFVFTNGIY